MKAPIKTHRCDGCNRPFEVKWVRAVFTDSGRETGRRKSGPNPQTVLLWNACFDEATRRVFGPGRFGTMGGTVHWSFKGFYAAIRAKHQLGRFFFCTKRCLEQAIAKEKRANTPGELRGLSATYIIEDEVPPF